MLRLLPGWTGYSSFMLWYWKGWGGGWVVTLWTILMWNCSGRIVTRMMMNRRWHLNYEIIRPSRPSNRRSSVRRHIPGASTWKTNGSSFLSSFSHAISSHSCFVVVVRVYHQALSLIIAQVSLKALSLLELISWRELGLVVPPSYSRERVPVVFVLPPTSVYSPHFILIVYYCLR